MSGHRIIWIITGVVVLITALVIMTREAGEQSEELDADAETPASPAASPLPEAMITALQNDPEMEDEKTRAVIAEVAHAAAAQGSAARGAVSETTGAESQYAMGLYYTEQGEVESAEKAFRAALEERPDWSWALNSLGILLANHVQGRTQEAEAAFRSAIRLDPGWYRPHNDLAVLLRILGRLDEAEKEAAKGLELSPYSVAAHNNYGNLLTVRKKYPEAEAQYLKAIELNARHPKPYYNLACLYALEGDKDDALPLLEKAVALDPALREEAARDPDFTSLSKDAQFQEILKAGAEIE